MIEEEKDMNRRSQGSGINPINSIQENVISSKKSTPSSVDLSSIGKNQNIAPNQDLTNLPPRSSLSKPPSSGKGITTILMYV